MIGMIMVNQVGRDGVRLAGEMAAVEQPCYAVEMWYTEIRAMHSRGSGERAAVELRLQSQNDQRLANSRSVRTNAGQKGRS